MGFVIHFYIIFGTNLLTQRPSPDCCFFCLFQGFAEKEYQTETKQNETFARDIFGGNHARKTLGPSQGTEGPPSRVGAPPPPSQGAPPASRAAHVAPGAPFFLYIPTYPRSSIRREKTVIPPP